MAWSITVICSEKQLSKFLRQSLGTYTAMSPPKEVADMAKKSSKNAGQRFKHKEIGLGYAITRKAIDDNLYKKEAKKRGRPRKLKIVTATDAPVVKKKRGRPRKNPLAQTAAA